MTKTNITETIPRQINNKQSISNVYKIGKYYCVAQNVNKKRIYYGKYKTREKAITVRNNLVKHGIITNRRGQHRIKNYQDRYIHKDRGKYTISKVINGKQEYFGLFPSREEARQERDYLESIEWDYSNME